MKDGLFQITCVCTGNICRSPMAEGILRSLLSPRSAEFATVNSAGTAAPIGQPASAHSVATCRESGIDISGHRSTQLTSEMIEAADLILVMEEHHRELIVLHDPRARARTFLFSEYGVDGPGSGVVDPIGQSSAVYRATFNELNEYISRMQPAVESAIAALGRTSDQSRRGGRHGTGHD